jgi:hypothetical protein
MTDLRYPIGPFQPPGKLSADTGAKAIETLETTPAGLRTAVLGLSEKQLDTLYRPGG